MRRCRRPAAWGAIAAVLALWAASGVSSAAGDGRDALIARWLAVNPHANLRAADATIAPPRQLRALATRELSSGYRLAASGPIAQPQSPWWLQAARWLGDRWHDLWRAAFGRARLGRSGAVAIGDLLLVVAVAVIAFALWRLLGTLLYDRSNAASRDSLEPRDDPSALYAAACERARGGEYAIASQLLFAATVGRMAQRGVVTGDRSATVGELRRALRRRDVALVAPFDAVSVAFVTGAYAERPVDAPLWERARRGYLAMGSGEPA